VRERRRRNERSRMTLPVRSGGACTHILAAAHGLGSDCGHTLDARAPQHVSHCPASCSRISRFAADFHCVNCMRALDSE
jgi:hypothetical protein